MNTLSTAIGLAYRKHIHIWIIIILTTLSYINIFGNSFVWDDEDLILNWQAIRSYANIPAAFITPTHPSYLDTYRPIRFVLATVTYSLFGENPIGYHVTTLAIHLTATYLIYLILKKLTDRPFIPFLTALFFGIHPVHTEAITWISSGLDMIGIVFLLLSLFYFLRPIHHRLSSIIFATLAYFSLELTVILPALLMLILWTQHTRVSWRTFQPTIPYGIAAGAFLLIRWMFVPVHGEFIYIDGKFFLTMLTMSRALLAYLGVLIWPVQLTVNHALGQGISSFMVEITNDFPPVLAAIRAQRFTDPTALAAGAILLIATLMVFTMRNRMPLVSVAIGWIFLALVPVSNVIPIHTLMAERYLYLPSIGFCLLLSLMIAPLFRKKIGMVLGTILVLGITTWYMSLTIARNYEWRNGLTLWTSAVERNPNSYIAAVALGKQYLLQKNFHQAAQTYERILDVYPEQKSVIGFLTDLYIYQKRYDAALPHALKAAKLSPAEPGPWIKLGDIYRAKNDETNALQAYHTGLSLDPTNEIIHARLKK